LEKVGKRKKGKKKKRKNKKVFVKVYKRKVK
jgi:hypothetical protein